MLVSTNYKKEETMKYIIALILKYPIKTLITTGIVLIGLFVGVTNITLKNR